jgi:hypothetical protein
VLRALPLCTCCRHYPGAAVERRLRSVHSTVSAFPSTTARSACTSTFSRLARRSLALRQYTRAGHQFVTLLPEGFSHFVTSMTAPVASGWSVWPGGACTHWKAPPWHGARRKRLFEVAEPSNAIAGTAASAFVCLASASRRPTIPAHWCSGPEAAVHGKLSPGPKRKHLWRLR